MQPIYGIFRNASRNALRRNIIRVERAQPQTLRQRCLSSSRRSLRQPAEDPDFKSIVDGPAVLVKAGGKRHGLGLIVLGCYPLSNIAAQANIPSFNTCHSLRPWHMAGPAPRLEEQTDRQIRGSPDSRSLTSTTARRSFSNKGLRLPPRPRHGPLQTRPRDADWTPTAR